MLGSSTKTATFTHILKYYIQRLSLENFRRNPQSTFSTVLGASLFTVYYLIYASRLCERHDF
jgi:hypothetical protein